MKFSLRKYLPSLLPHTCWGAEFLEDEVRLSAFAAGGKGIRCIHRFSGTYAEANDFARRHGLKFKGLNAAVSHLPCKINRMEIAPDADESAVEAEENRLRPVGLKAEQMALLTLPMPSSAPLLVQVRDNDIRDFIHNLPDELDTLTMLTPSPAVLALKPDLPPAPAAVLMAEDNYTHVLVRDKEGMRELVKLHCGSRHLMEEPTIFATELKKTLVYHWNAKTSLAPPVRAVFYNAPETCDLRKLSELCDIAITQPENGESAEPKYFIADALARSALRGGEPAADLTLAANNAGLAYTRQKWLGWADTTLRWAMGVSAFAFLSICIMFATAYVLDISTRSGRAAQSKAMDKAKAIRLKRLKVEKEIKKARVLLRERSRMSEFMQSIALSVPDKMWFAGWETGEDTPVIHRITGYCFTEPVVSKFLENLEKQNRFQTVKLKSTELIAGEKVQRLTKLKANRRALVRFQIEVGG